MSNSFEFDTDAIKETSGLWDDIGSQLQKAWGQIMGAQSSAMAGGAFSDGDIGRQVFSQYDGAVEQVEPAVTGAAGSMFSTSEGLITTADGLENTEEGLASGLGRNGFEPKGGDV